jgi:hypothetical protein
MKRINLYIVLILVTIAALGLAACSQEVTHEKTEPAELVDQGDGRNLVILTEKAAERLDIHTEPVTQEMIMLTESVGGEVTGIGSSNEAMVMVSLRVEDLTKLDANIPARIVPLNLEDSEDSDNGEAGFAAELDELPGLDDTEEDGETHLVYTVSNPGHGLIAGQKLIVELSMKQDEAARLVVPVGALLYDLNGETWVYISLEPLQFLRYPVQVDYIQGGKVVLLEGPPVGTEVATVGVAELHGTDTGVGK